LKTEPDLKEFARYSVLEDQGVLRDFITKGICSGAVWSHLDPDVWILTSGPWRGNI
jgi:hypothetical protein